MPIKVHREERRQQIIDAAIMELAEVGIGGFKLKNVGLRLGGSVTLITHYFESRAELFSAALEQVLRKAELFQSELEEERDPDSRISRMIQYFIPETDMEFAFERARVNLSSHAVSDPEIRGIFEQLDPRMRAVVQVGLESILPTELLPDAIDLVRVWASGLVLLILEQPQAWSEARKANAIRSILVALEALRDGRGATLPIAAGE